MLGPKALIRRLCRPVRADLAADPRLRYVLVLALLTASFGVWFRVPNFATPDEFSRLLHPMKPVGTVAADPGFDVLRSAVLDGRALGATFYLYALVLAPMFVLVLASGNFGEFASLGSIESRWELWHATPEWFWTGTILLGRLVSVVVAVGCVYLTYRLGTELRDRRTGRIAAVALTLSVAFLAQAHLVGEDIPMLFLVLLSILFAHRFVESGRARVFLLSALVGGLAIAFKLSGGVTVVVLGVAFVLRGLRSEDPRTELARPRLVVGGLAIGFAAVYVGIPSVLVGGPMELLTRVTGSFGSKTGKSGGLAAPIWYWLVRGYVAGLGLPLFLAVLAGLGAGARRWLRDRNRPDPIAVMLVVAVGVFLVVYSRWEFVRIRHLVPTFPMLFVLSAAEISRRYDQLNRRRALRFGLAVVLMATVTFVAVAEIGYVTEPRDQATRWISTNTPEDATVEVYENSISDVGTPHGRETSHYPFPEEQATNSSSLVLNDSAYTEWMLDLPERQPAYIQLTANEFGYVDPTNPDSERYPQRRAFVHRLMNGEYDYEVVAEFGTRPSATTLQENFVSAMLHPDVDGQEEYVVILERTTSGGTS